VTARRLHLQLIAAISGAPLILVVTVVAAWHTPDYSGWRDTVSRLGSPGQPWQGGVRVTFVVYGLLVAVGCAVLARSRGYAHGWAWAVGIFAMCAVVAGVAPKDMPGEPHTTASTVHVFATIVGGISVVGALLYSSRVDANRRVRLVSAALAVATVIATIAFRLTWGSYYYGAIERLILIPPMSWLSGLAVVSAGARVRSKVR